MWESAFLTRTRYGDGWTQGGGTPDAFAESLEKLNAEWSSAGRDGKPRAAALVYFALGNDPERVARESLGDYYRFLGDYADRSSRAPLRTPTPSGSISKPSKRPARTK